jgi:AraC-like DNA-binding protein
MKLDRATNRIPIGMSDALAEVGVSYREVLARAGLPDRHLDMPGDRVTMAEYFALWAAVSEASSDPGVGIKLAQAVKPDLMEPLFLAMLSSRTVKDAISVLVSYKRMLSAERIEHAIDEHDGASVLTYRWPPSERECPQVLVDAELAFIVEGFRRATRTPELAPLEVRMRAKTLPRAAGHASFFRCPVRLGQADNGLTIAAEDAARPFVTHNPRMLAALVPYLKENLPEEDDTFLARIRTLLAARIRGRKVTVQAVGKELGMSDRALQRALQQSGTSFRELLDVVRNEQAQRYLARASFSDGEVAFLLGFEDPSSFSRAFRAWNGVSPTEFRGRPGHRGTSAEDS